MKNTNEYQLSLGGGLSHETFVNYLFILVKKSDWYHYFPYLTLGQKKQLGQLEIVYNYWNSKINVVSRKDIQHLQVRHILHSLAIAKVVQFPPHTKVIDIGTGGGFPGIPLAIMFPETQFYLIERIKKKIKVVQDIAQQLALKNILCFTGNAENIPFQAHYFVCRAVSKIEQILTWTNEKIISLPPHLPSPELGGIYCLKGGDWEGNGLLRKEFSGIERECTCYAVSDFFDEDFFLTKKVIHISNK